MLNIILLIIILGCSICRYCQLCNEHGVAFNV